MSFIYKLSEVTIVIPTFNRQKTLKKNLDFLNSFKNKIIIKIIDSSFKKSTIDFEKFKYLEISYQYFDHNINLSKKIYLGTRYIKTEFIVLCPDDDFIIPTTLDKLVNFLQINKDYACAQGLFFQHALSQRFWKKMNFTYLYPNNKSNESPLSHQRCENYFSGKTNHVFYSVIRTYIFKKIWKFIMFYANFSLIMEHTQTFLINLYGKTKVLNYLYLSRDGSVNDNVINIKIINKQYDNIKILKLINNIVTYFNLKKKDAPTLVLFKQYLIRHRINYKEVLKRRKNFFYKIYYFIYVKIYSILFSILFFKKKIKNKIEYYYLKYRSSINELRNSRKLYSKTSRFI